MGMYDQIKFDYKCPKCGAKVTNFQSKDGPCLLTTLEYWEVDNFYTHCPKCEAWIEFTRKRPKGKIPLSAYRMEVSP